LSQLCLWCVSLVLLNDLVSFVNMARWCRPANTIASGSKCTPCSPQAVGQDLAWSCRDRTVGLLKSLQVIWSSLTWKMHDGTSALHQNHTMVNHGWQQKRFCMSCTGHHDTCASVLQESTKLCKDDHHDLWQTIAQKTQNVFVSDVYSVLKSAIVFESDVSSSVWRLKAKGSETGIHYNIAIKLK